MSIHTAAAKKVTIIPADPQYTQKDIRKQHLRVAPYCRVSTDKEEQLSSYEAQIEYYTARIAENPDWTMVRMYADEGISGTSMKKRKEFLKMVEDCEKGKIDLVITKSTTRFARNSLMIFEKYANLKYKYGNRHYWYRGYYVSTVGRNRRAIEQYIRNQLQEDYLG